MTEQMILKTKKKMESIQIELEDSVSLVIRFFVFFICFFSFLQTISMEEQQEKVEEIMFLNNKLHFLEQAFEIEKKENKMKEDNFFKKKQALLEKQELERELNRKSAQQQQHEEEELTRRQLLNKMQAEPGSKPVKDVLCNFHGELRFHNYYV